MTNRTVFEYDDYRELLKDLFKSHKIQNPKFSHRFFSRVAGFKSPNFLIKVMQGKSNLSEESTDKFIKAFKLNAQESRFFKNLVLLNQAKSFEEREIYSGEIRKLRAYRKIQPLSEAQYNYYSKWYFIPVRELVGLPDFREDPAWVAKAIIPHITLSQAEEALEELKILGLILYDPSGKLIPASVNIATPDEVLSTSITRYHQDSMRLAFESIQRVDKEKRDISAVTLGIPNESLTKAKEIISKFRRDILELTTQDPPCDSVYQLNIQLFPVAEVKRGNDKKKED